MAIDKKISYEVQGGVKNYLGKQKEVTAPVKWKSSPNHPETELAYITKAEKDLLVKKALHGSLKGGVNRGPSGIMSLNGFGSEDPNQNVSGSQISAAETGSAGSGMSAQDRDDFRSAAIAAGAGQRVNPGFFDDRNTVSKAELARAKKFAPKAFRATRGGIGNFLQGGGILGAILGGIGRAFGLGKRYNTPYDRPEFAPGFATNPPQMQYDVGNELLEELAKQQSNNLASGFVTGSNYPGANKFKAPEKRNTLASVEFNRIGDLLDGVTDEELYGNFNTIKPTNLNDYTGINSLSTPEQTLEEYLLDIQGS